MAITINGSGTISGITAGGLPDGVVDGDTLASSIDLTGKTLTDPQIAGGVYLGGTGSANYLDDYEEGTWTPTSAIGTFSTVDGSYTKIGNRVFLTCYMTGPSDYTSGNTFEIESLPFTPVDPQPGVAGGAMVSYLNADSGTYSLSTYLRSSGPGIRLYMMVDAGAYQAVTYSNFVSSSFNLRFVLNYITAS